MTGIAAIKKKAKITGKSFLAENICRMELETDLCAGAGPGQFVLVYPPDRSRLLGRPLCIADADDHSLTIVFRIAGGGTGEIACCREGDLIDIEGPLGKGYPYDEKTTDKKSIVLLGGGLGAPSLLFLAKKLREKGSGALAVLGYRDSSLKHFLADDFRKLCDDTIITTDDGSEGLHGNVLDALAERKISADLIYACGPMPMLSAVKAHAIKHGAES